ncbi:MAG TPA: DUF1848 family protein [Candidatus Lokiarchaeia archaeon]|nr:DUF1848 family protein [Candidatus Lokiarchaeia archaeon]
MLKQIISASRRTDLPRWFLPEVMQWFGQGFVDVPNPFSGRISRVDLTPDAVHSIAWWSKDFSRWLKNAEYFDAYTNSFQFTINAEQGTFLEPGLSSSLEERIDQFHDLAGRYGANAINWRFDPIVFWNGGQENNLSKFDFIAGQLARAGIARMTFSFATWYGKCMKRAKRHNFAYSEPSADQKYQTLFKLAKLCENLGIEMHGCCNPDLENMGIPNVAMGRCIDGEVLSGLAGKGSTTQQDTGQREACRCTRSRDIGRYDFECKHGCLYCYANPRV